MFNTINEKTGKWEIWDRGSKGDPVHADAEPRLILADSATYREIMEHPHNNGRYIPMAQKIAEDHAALSDQA